MDRPCSDRGLAGSSYTRFRYPSANQQLSSMPISVKTGLFSALLPGLDGRQTLPDTCFSQAACHLSQEFPVSDYSPDARIHMTPQSSHKASDDQVWPSPPLAPGDISSCVPFPKLPASASVQIPCYTHSPVSPTAWSMSSPTSSFIQPHDLFQAATVESPGYIHICTPTSSKDFSLSGSDVPTPYTGGGFHHQPQQDVECETAGLDGTDLTPASPATAARLPAMPPSCSGAGSPDELCVTSPASVGAATREGNVAPAGKGKRKDALGGGLVRSFTCSTPADVDMVDAKNEEPYAKLIYKAFMSRPDHCMPLQDIYQWFRDNTNKAVDEKGGWQNSIRHNLSMNGAFTRREQKQAGELAARSSSPSSGKGGAASTAAAAAAGGGGGGGGGGGATSMAMATADEISTATTAGGSGAGAGAGTSTNMTAMARSAGDGRTSSSSTGSESKRANEWVLEDWAVREGVQSTTRYRKGSSNRRTARYTSHPDGVCVGRRSHGHGNGNANANANANGSQPQHSTTRALSGRKGGCATKASRMRGQRCGSLGSPMRRLSQYPVMMQHEHHAHHAHHPQAHALTHAGADSASSGHGLAAATNAYLAAAVAPMSRLESPLPLSSSSSSSSSAMAQMQHDGGSFALQHQHQHQHQQRQDGGSHGSLSAYVLDEGMYLASPVGEFPYGIADVHLSYADGHESGRFFDVGADWGKHEGI